MLLVGARVNWMLHFGTQPRWNQKVKLIQVTRVGSLNHDATADAIPMPRITRGSPASESRHRQ